VIFKHHAVVQYLIFFVCIFLKARLTYAFHVSLSLLTAMYEVEQLVDAAPFIFHTVFIALSFEACRLASLFARNFFGGQTHV